MTLDELVSSSRAGYDAPTAADKARVRAKLSARLADAALEQPPVSDVFPIAARSAPKTATAERTELLPNRRRRLTATKVAILAAALFAGTASALAAHGAYVAHARALSLASATLTPSAPQPHAAAPSPAAPLPLEPPPIVSEAPAPPPPAPRMPHASVAPPVDPAAALSVEMQLVQDARDALQRGDPGEALATLDRFNARFKSPTLAPEAAGLRVLALCAAGRTDEAHARAVTFLHKWPHSPLAARVEQKCAETRGSKP